MPNNRIEEGMVMEEKIFTRSPRMEYEKLKNYYKSYNLEMTPTQKAKLDIVKKGPIDSSMALKFQDRNDLFDPGYLDTEIGYCIMEDGTGFLANLTIMPEVTTEMFNWWFMHKERYCNETCDVIKNIGKGLENIHISFKYPGDLSFDVSRIGNEECSSVVCAIGHIGGHSMLASTPIIIAHFLREITGGVELRTRFWIGWNVIDGKDLKVLQDGHRISEEVLMNLLLNDMKEYAYLANILPQIFAEKKEKF